MKGVLIFGIVFLYLVCSVTCQAQRYSNFHFRKLQVEDGLSENTIYCIVQDQQGFMWFGTKDGLNRYDGNSFKNYHYQSEKKQSLGNNFVRSIAEKSPSHLYIGTDDGLYIMDKITAAFQKVELSISGKGTFNSAINALHVDRQGSLWIATMSQGIWKYNPSTTKITQLQLKGARLGQNATWAILQDRSGVIWAATRLGLLRFNNQQAHFDIVGPLFSEVGDPQFEILSMWEDPKGDLWLGTWSQGLLRYNKQSNEFSRFLNNTSHPYVTHIRALREFRENQLLVGSDDGLFLFHTETGTSERLDIPYYKHGLSDQNVYSIARDRENAIWIGTYFGGINYLNTALLSVETFFPDILPGFLSGKAVSQFCEDTKGNLWIATEDGGINYYDKEKKQISQPIKASYHNTHALLLDGDHLWIGTFSRGLDRYNLATGQRQNFRHDANNTETINDDCIFSLFKTKKGDLLIGTPAGLSRYDQQKKKFVRIPEVTQFIYDIKEDDEGNIWLASYQSGPIKFDLRKQAWVHYSLIRPNDPISSSKLTSIYVDSQHRLLFSSEGKGIFIYDKTKDSFRNIGQAQGLPNNVIYGILDDALGNLWLSSNKGIICFHPDNPKNYKLYTTENGFSTNQFNFKASFKASDGRFYFGGINGFTSFYPDEISAVKNQAVPNVFITQIQLLNKHNPNLEKDIQIQLNKNEKIVLTHQFSSFNISFVSLSFASPSKNQYAHKLEGADDEWTSAGNTKSVSYVNLSPGTYVFHVKASNNDGLWNEKGAAVQIEILPPLWLSLPAKITYALLFVALCYVCLRYYIMANKRKQARDLMAFQSEQEQKSFRSKIDFFTNIAHEIRTPLSLITAPLEEIILQENEDKETMHNLRIIEKNCERLTVLINQLLDFRKMDGNGPPLSPESVNLKNLLEDLYDRFRKSVHRNRVRFDLSIPQDQDLIIETDLDAVMKIVSNLLTNATKFAHSYILINLKRNSDKSFTITVSDDGPGIPDDFKKLVFDPFYQLSTNKDRSGTGIGLSLVKHLTNRLGAEIKIEDMLPRGAKFIFTIRSMQLAHEATGPIIEEQPIPLDRPEYNLTQILVVDDNPDITAFISHSLAVSYHIDIADSGSKALTMLDNKVYHLVISDIMMPEIDGITFVKRLKNDINYSHIPVILLSAKIQNATKVEGLLSGADVFIEKPFSMTFLKAQISSLLQNRKYLLENFHASPLSSYSSLATNAHDDAFLTQLNAEIEKHLSDEQFNVESLVDIFKISRSNFQRKLKAISGTSPGDYVRNYRLKRACTLLIESDYRINEVAFLVGFSSASYFTKAFIKAFNLTPKEFIQQSRSQAR
ncbi:hybrid sensor histidine kinase/response regulator transcription factor [Sphingobacterium sp. DR205]|uniref:hybrid sensor histidine kinase/response regulator transcription factor n=1 Tax=Sphingobacterium sp. DR205 TaxID=2713573 RepID=UPI0013E43F0A|nr:hybrid sensor histidine kinase/response regulator transcription factor [Sphingobacterium sp. DR205]QIH35665.1 response regulator [Sphingobacterium sp. DR205]